MNYPPNPQEEVDNGQARIVRIIQFIACMLHELPTKPQEEVDNGQAHIVLIIQLLACMLHELLIPARRR